MVKLHVPYKNQVATFPAILDSFSLSVDCIRQVSTWVGTREKAGKMVALNLKNGVYIRPSYGPFRYLN